MFLRKIRLTTIGPLVISAILLVVFSIIFVISAGAGSANIQEGLDAVSIPILTTTSTLLFNPLYNLDATGINRVLDPYVDGTTIIYAAVYDANNTQVVEINKKWAPDSALSSALSNQALSQPEIAKSEVGNYLVLTKSITAGTVQIGTVEIVLDQAPLQASLGKAQATISITLIVALIVITLLFIIGFQFAVRPLNHLALVAQEISHGNLSAKIPVEGTEEISFLASTLSVMVETVNNTIATLEERVTERTSDVEMARLFSERRAQELQAISEVSRTISTEQRLEILLPLVTRLVSERFDFYHVGIFFVDATKQFAILQAANSEGGKRMLERGHRLEVGLTGIVGTVSQTGKPRIALDVGSDSVFFDNPDLPGTRSEMTLPLNFRGEIIGVLDVQSIKPGAFTESDANTLSILADQIAIAIENARLFGQTQQAREEAEALYSQFQRLEWKSFAQQETTIGYNQSAIGGKTIAIPVETEEILAALQKGEVVILDGKNTKAQSIMAVPVKLRDQTIGVLNIKAPAKNRKWNQDEINLAQAISDRLALALENARLLLASQRRASKEAKIGEVTAKIGASINMRNVLQTAVEELGRALPGSEVLIQFESSEEN
jgi:GAF domain-containing protein/HAMP domain-containing protein